MKKYIVSVVGGIVVALAIVVACMTIADLTYTNSRVEAETATEVTRKADKGITKEIETSAVQIIEIKNEETEKTENEEILEVTVPEVKYFDCALSKEVQDCIFAECEKNGISPAVVIAMIERESGFDRYAIGDDGRSFGLMQIQTKWHIKRMIELECTDLFEPHKNVTVGIDILAELQNRYGDITKALVAYNAGSYNGTITNYAYAVMARANEIERGC